VIEAMMAGVPVVGLATTEMVTVIRDGESGFLHTDIGYLITRMQQLLDDRELALCLGEKGRQVATERFNIQRFTANWHKVLSGIVTERTFELAAM
jgi:glycosyltransferase involved in cell wall biosynthesis